ncbi:hypothetical protein PYCCODRAFT_1464583 [Trametes coccinea BRFM310]|uniref:DUF6534 domain-containing protein n=1 Tax=Trametes coccinea (strain BRFM310) TaxID=1353009 RepID=A0A1Y2IXR9_TRAC3|nr:hypothetical protein PYCCODRAFT_1464583 [Trametes coccinea BRFM310]
MASLSSLTSLLDAFKVSVGAWLVGTFISTLGVGMLLQQTVRYFRLYPTDPHFLKIWVLLAVVFQMITTAMVMHTCYYYLVTYYFNPAVFTKKDILWTAALVPVFGSIGNLICESFFVRRVYMMGRQYRLIALSGLTMILVSCGFYIVKTVEAFTLHIVANALVASGWIPTAAAALLLAGDIQLTAILVYVLHKGRSGIKRTDSMVDLLIMYAISSGSLICVLNIVSLVLSVVFPHYTFFSAATLVAQTVYSNSFVVALNTRQLVRARGELDDTNIVTGVVLGEDGRGDEGAVKQVELPLRSMVFAAGPSTTQLTDNASAIYDSRSDGTTAIAQDGKHAHVDFDTGSDLEKGHSTVNVLATV